MAKTENAWCRMRGRGVCPALLVLAAVAWLNACTPATVRDESSGAYVDLVGGSVVLNRPLGVPAGSARVFLQHGSVVAKHELNLYAPSCDFEVHDVLETGQVIAPDRFDIVRAGVNLQEWVNRGPLRLADLSGGYLVGGVSLQAARDDGAPMVMYTWRLQLGSERQPQVLALTCRGEMGDPGRIEKATLQDMQSALGAYAEINPAGVRP